MNARVHACTHGQRLRGDAVLAGQGRELLQRRRAQGEGQGASVWQAVQHTRQCSQEAHAVLPSMFHPRCAITAHH